MASQVCDNDSCQAHWLYSPPTVPFTLSQMLYVECKCAYLLIEVEELRCSIFFLNMGVTSQHMFHRTDRLFCYHGSEAQLNST